MKSFVKLDFDIVGFHNYEGAPEDVSFLQDRHRHIFTVRCKYAVTDLNREKEIFIQTDFVKEYLIESYGSPCEFGAMSCEMIAKDLLDHIRDDGGVWVEVLEDNKGGAVVEL